MINIANLLKGAPEGMPLYSPLFGNVELNEVRIDNDMPIRITRGYAVELFDKYGRYYKGFPDTECLLFPSKDYRTWEGWTPPIEPKFKVGDWVVRKDGETFYGGNYAEQVTLIECDGYIIKCIWFSSGTWLRDNAIRLWTIQDAKDGDVLVTTKIRSCPFIYRKTNHNNNLAYYYAGIDGNGNFCEGYLKRTLFHFGSVSNVMPATKEQRDLLFKKMKEAGYQWDVDKKELRKIQPHYDIANFHAGMPVLTRADNVCRWDYSVFSRITGNKDWQFAVCNGVSFTQCIPFEGNEHLLGTTDMPDERFINW